MVTVTGGKLTTYRAMAQDAVDAALVAGRFLPRECRTQRLPLVGATAFGASQAPGFIVEAHGSEADLVVAEANGDASLLEPIAAGLDMTPAQFLFGVRHEGALTVDDLVDRRTRLGMCADDREKAVEVAQWALDQA